MDYISLAAKIIMHEVEPKNFTDWAMEVLETGQESESVAILAGLGFERQHETDELKEYFYSGLDELGLDLPANRECLLHYAKSTCLNMIGGKISPRLGASILNGIYLSIDYEPPFAVWDYLESDIDCLDRVGMPIYNTGITKDNINQYIVFVAEQFLKLLDMELPQNFMDLTACKKCGYVGLDTTVRYEKIWMPKWIFRILYRRRPAVKSICAKCGETSPLWMRDYQGRELYLKKKSHFSGSVG